MYVDVTSDIHLDSWISPHIPEFAQEVLFHQLIKKLLPEIPSTVLIIAGDLGHYNKQNAMFLRVVKQYYDDIILVFGNHDIYLLTHAQRKIYHRNSMERLNEMMEMTQKIEGVHYLNGTTVEINGLTFGGTGMWYHNDFAKKEHHKTGLQCRHMFYKYMLDSKVVLMPGEEKRKFGHDYEKLFRTEYKKLEKIYKQCDCIITHVGPDWSRMLAVWKAKPESTFFYFNGKELLNGITKENVVWIFGHTHDKYYYEHESGVYMVCNPLDYGHKFPYWTMHDLPTKIVPIFIGKQPSYEETFKNV